MRLRWLLGLINMAGCKADLDGVEVPPLVKISPAGVSTGDAWRLFDRSIGTGFTPATDPVRVTFARTEQLSAIKVYGASPYKLHVTGWDEIDLSTNGHGWRTFSSNEVVSASEIELRFEGIGTATEIPELNILALVADHRNLAT